MEKIKVLIITMTYNRLEMTKKYLGQLKDKAGFKYKHIVVDNGSSDGTPEWLKQNNYDVIPNVKNVGIARAWEQGVDYAINELGFKPDLVGKFDDDCFIETDDILKKMVEFVSKNKNCSVSPIDLNIETAYIPKRVSREDKIGNYRVRVTTHTGGMFVLMPIEAYNVIRGVEKDVIRGEVLRINGFKNVYLKDLSVRHQGVGLKRDYKF